MVEAASLRVVIAEDSVLLREGLTRLIGESGGTVVARVGDGPALVSAWLDHRPDLAVVDVRMPPSHRDDGLRAALEVRRLIPAPRSWSSASTSNGSTRPSCSPTAAAGSATC